MGIYLEKLPQDVRENTRRHRTFAEDVVNAQRARRHLAAMPRERLAQLQAEWLAAEAINDRSLIEAERKSIVTDALLKENGK